MINLSPYDHKKSIKYARRNTILLKWLSGLFAILTLTVVTLGIGQAYLKSESKKYATANANIEKELKDKDLEGTLKTVGNISGNLKLIVQVLSKQIIFSELIKQVGAVMPENSVLSDIEISKVEGGIDLTADARDQNTATQVQVNLADPYNKLFDKVDIVSVNCDSTTNPEYPCKVILRALFTKNNPFSFTNQNNKDKQ